MANVDFELNLPGLNELMKSGEMQAVLRQAGQSVANAAGSEYASEVHVASFTAISNVFPNSKKAARDNFENNSLIKAAGSSGLSM